MKSRTLQLAAAVALIAGVVLLVRARVPSERQEAILAVCDAVEAERFREAVDASEELVTPDRDGFIVAECRCWALLSLGERDSCAELIDQLLVDASESDWVPHPVLSALVIRYRGERARDVEASNLAIRATREHPEEIRLLELEIQARSATEGVRDTLRAMEARLTDSESSYFLRIALAGGYLRNHDAVGARRALGARAPARSHPLWLAWFAEHSRALGFIGDIEEMKRHFRRWSEAGGEPFDLRARYVLRVSVSGLVDPDASEIEMLSQVLENHERLQDPRLRWGLYRRLIGSLSTQGEIEAALEVYDEAIQFVSFPTLPREELERAARAPRSSSMPESGEVTSSESALSLPGTISFELHPAITVAGELWMSPEAALPGDTEYERLALVPGAVLEIERRPAITPQRWVFRSDAEGVVASGAVWPVSGSRVQVEVKRAVEPQTARSLPHPVLPPRSPGDGRRRLFTVVVDCADWRLVQYLRARDELPLIEYLMQNGHRAVLESTPAFTAAAMESLVWPTRGERVSLLGLIRRMGLELGGLASVGRNPVGFLAAILPASQSLFEVVGAGDRVAANMLFSHGGINSGHHAEMVGPRGARRRLDLKRSHRRLSATETEQFMRAEIDPGQRRRFETIAAEFDNALDIVRAKEVDLLLIRIEPLDLLTHAFFGDLLQGRQDDGESPLFDAYRYIDHRLAQLYRELDADDYLLVMSDHGIRTSMEHETDAIFLLIGEGVPVGRARGMPHLRGVPRILASLVGVDTDWPESELAAQLLPLRNRTGEAPSREPGITNLVGQ